MKPWLPVSVLFCSAAIVSSQVKQDPWQKKHDLNNRYEGLIDIPTGNPAFEVLSFTSFFLPFIGKQEWQVRYYSPDQTQVTVYARDTDSQVQYWMESKPRPAYHWSLFDKWDTGAVLVPEMVKASSVGVTVQAAGSEGLYLPAVVYPSAQFASLPGQIDRYTLRLRANRTITRVEYEITDETHGKSYESKSSAGVRVAGDPFPLVLDMQEIPEGRMSMTIKAFNGELAIPSLSRQLKFYHHPRMN